MKGGRLRIVVGAIALAAAGVLLWRMGVTRSEDFRHQLSMSRARAFVAQGSWVEAWVELHEAIGAIRAIGHDHPDYLETVLLLAETQEAIGYHEEAYPLYIEALRLYRERLGPNAPEIASMFHEMGRVQQRLGATSTARGIYEQALMFWEQSVGTDHPYVVPTLVGLAEVHRDSGDLDRAQQNYEWAIAVQRRNLGPMHQSIAPLERTLAAVLRQKGDTERAERFEEHARAIEANEKALQEALQIPE